MIKLTGTDAPKGIKKVIIQGINIKVTKDDGTVVDLVEEGLDWGYHQPVIKSTAQFEKALRAAVNTVL